MSSTMHWESGMQTTDVDPVRTAAIPGVRPSPA
jgi:hypothetical protein